jgi:hypothetical protein
LALDPTCNSCTALVCFNHPECCTDDGDPLTDPDWDAACVGYFEQECGIECEPGENICSNALPIGAGVIHGTLLESNNDGCASSEGRPGGVSCNSGDVWYTYTQGTAEDRVISTCTSQRSFAVDSVVSVHRGCPGKKNNEIVANDDWRLGSAPDACDLGTPDPNNVDAGILLRANALDPGETVVIRVSHHGDSFRAPFELRVLPEPEVWLALVAGAGALGALSRRRARG